MDANAEALLLVEQADEIATSMLDDMEGMECVDMVRQFCQVMAEWQPNIKTNADNPVLLGLHCLATAQLFRLAFTKGYTETDSRIKAQEAIEKALKGLE